MVLENAPRREDARHVRAAVLVAHDTVVGPDAGPGDQLGGGLDAESKDRQIALDAAPAPGHDALDAAGPLERRYGIAQDKLDPVVTVEPLDPPTDLLAERPVEWRLEGLDRGDLETALAHRRRYFGADEAHADHDGTAPARDRVADETGVGHCAQVVDPRQVEPGNRKAPVSAPGGDEDVVELEPLTALEVQRSLLRIDAHDPGLEPRLDVALAVELRLAQQCLLERHPAAQIRLGERRAVVRPLGLPAQKHGPPLATAPAPRRRRAGARAARPPT